MNAPQYIVTNGSKYKADCSGKRCCDKASEAYRWKTEEAAVTQANQMNRVDKSSVWHVEMVDGVSAIQMFDANMLSIKSSPEFVGMVDELRRCVLTIAHVKSMMEKCTEGISEQDRIQEDILHKIEFEYGGKGNGAHLCSLLHQCRKKRRGYKDMLIMLQTIGHTTIANMDEKSLADVQDKLSNRKYHTKSSSIF